MAIHGRSLRAIRAVLIVAALAFGMTIAAGGSVVAADPSPSAASQRPTVPVPESIDATGATDASAALTSFLDTVPDGSTIAFRAGAVYLMDRGLKFSDRHDLTFEGNGATLRSNGDTHELSSLFALWGGNTGIAIRDFNLVGNSTTPGVYQAGSEGAHGVLIDGGSDVDGERRDRERRVGRRLLRRPVGRRSVDPRLHGRLERAQWRVDHRREERDRGARGVHAERLLHVRHRVQRPDRGCVEHQLHRQHGGYVGQRLPRGQWRGGLQGRRGDGPRQPGDGLDAPVGHHAGATLEHRLREQHVGDPVRTGRSSASPISTA